MMSKTSCFIFFKISIKLSVSAWVFSKLSFQNNYVVMVANHPQAVFLPRLVPHIFTCSHRRQLELQPSMSDSLLPGTAYFEPTDIYQFRSRHSGWHSADKSLTVPQAVTWVTWLTASGNSLLAGRTVQRLWSPRCRLCIQDHAWRRPLSNIHPRIGQR